MAAYRAPGYRRLYLIDARLLTVARPLGCHRAATVRSGLLGSESSKPWIVLPHRNAVAKWRGFPIRQKVDISREAGPVRDGTFFGPSAKNKTRISRR